MDSEFLSMMPHTFQVERYTGDDSFGNPQYGNAESFKCRRESVTSQRGVPVIYDSTSGKPVNFTARLICGLNNIKTRDKIVTPDGINPKAMTVVTEDDENGPYHQIIFVEEDYL